MNFLRQFSSVCAIAALAYGCRTPNPYVLEIDPPPTGGIETMVVSGERREKVAVHVYPTGHQYGEDVANELDAKLSESIGSLAFFELVPRGGIDPLIIESMLSGRNDRNVMPPADYVISAKAVNIHVAEQRVSVDPSALDMLLARKLNVSQPAAHGESRFTVSLSINFQFFQCAQYRTIKTKTISRTGQGLWEGVIQAWLLDAPRECAQEFAQALGGRYAPEARVIQTRGGHEVAWISLGANYGLSEGTEVNFFTYMDNLSFIAGDKRFKNIVGSGRVFLLEEDSAWVEVFDAGDVHVEQGMYVGIQHRQTDEFRWRYFFRRLGNLFKY